MTKPSLTALLKQQFPNAAVPEETAGLGLGSFPEWDSLAHFNFLLLVEETYGIRFSLEEMAELKGVADIARALAAQGVELP